MASQLFDFELDLWNQDAKRVKELKDLKNIGSRNDLQGVIIARVFLQRWISSDLNAIMTTNYDLLVEYSLSSKIFNYGKRYEILSGSSRSMKKLHPIKVCLSGKLPLLKLHRSICWAETGEKYHDGRRGITGDALIVLPIREKIPVGKLESRSQTSKLVE